jgi:hypothetical protein
MSGAIPPFPNTPSWRGAELKHRNNFTFTMTASFQVPYDWPYMIIGLAPFYITYAVDTALLSSLTNQPSNQATNRLTDRPTILCCPVTVIFFWGGGGRREYCRSQMRTWDVLTAIQMTDDDWCKAQRHTDWAITALRVPFKWWQISTYLLSNGTTENFLLDSVN